MTDHYPAIRGREQLVQEALEKRGKLTEQIRGVSERNDKLDDYLDAARREWPSPKKKGGK